MSRRVVKPLGHQSCVQLNGLQPIDNGLARPSPDDCAGNYPSGSRRALMIRSIKNKSQGVSTCIDRSTGITYG